MSLLASMLVAVIKQNKIEEEPEIRKSVDDVRLKINVDMLIGINLNLRSMISPKYVQGMDEWYVIKYTQFKDMYSSRMDVMEKIIFLNLIDSIPNIYKLKLINGTAVAEPTYSVDSIEFWKVLAQTGLLSEP